jgi:hypothetical protein
MKTSFSIFSRAAVNDSTMFDTALTTCLRRLGSTCCMRVYGKGRYEPEWRIVDVVASSRRTCGSSWPFLGGSCTTWTSSIIAVGWDFAQAFLAEQIQSPASRDRPVGVASGRLRDAERRSISQAAPFPTFSEVMAHECGHTAQALRLGVSYLPLVGSVTRFREGNHWWNHWENDASVQGLMGGIAEIVIPREQWPLPGRN